MFRVAFSWISFGLSFETDDFWWCRVLRWLTYAACDFLTGFSRNWLFEKFASMICPAILASRGMAKGFESWCKCKYGGAVVTMIILLNVDESVLDVPRHYIATRSAFIYVAALQTVPQCLGWCCERCCERCCEAVLWSGALPILWPAHRQLIKTIHCLQTARVLFVDTHRLSYSYELSDMRI